MPGIHSNTSPNPTLMKNLDSKSIIAIDHTQLVTLIHQSIHTIMNGRTHFRTAKSKLQESSHGVKVFATWTLVSDRDVASTCNSCLDLAGFKLQLRLDPSRAVPSFVLAQCSMLTCTCAAVRFGGLEQCSLHATADCQVMRFGEQVAT